MTQRSIDSAEALYRKLERSFHRRPAYGEQQVDWVFDVAVTAWHLVDWVARERHAAGKADVQGTQDQLRNKCAELAVCEQLCNGAKHLVLDNPQLKPFDVTTDVRATNDLIGISRMNLVAGDESADVVLTPAVLIIDKDRTAWEAIDLFRRVLAFWGEELRLQPLDVGYYAVASRPTKG